MTATRPRRHGKRAFLALLATVSLAGAGEAPDLGWRLTMIPSHERPALHEKVPGSQTALLAVGRHIGYDEIEYATTPAAWRWARERADADGEEWIGKASVEVRRDHDRVINRILITGTDPLLPALALTPAFYQHFEPVLGDGFHVIIPDRYTIALYPRLAGNIPAGEAGALLETFRIATYPVSREVFRATRSGLVADGVLEE